MALYLEGKTPLDGNDLSPQGKVPFLSPFAYPCSAVLASTRLFMKCASPCAASHGQQKAARIRLQPLSSRALFHNASARILANKRRKRVRAIDQKAISNKRIS
jgi:hypothetical protein